MKGRLFFITMFIFILLTFSTCVLAKELKLPSLFEPDKSFSASDFKGKAVLLNFWTIRCPYCKMELPILNKVQSIFPEDVKVISVLFGGNSGDLDEAKNWIKANKLDNILFLVDRDGSLFGEFGVMGVPHTVFFDRDGNKVTELRGAFPEDFIVSLVRKILGK